MRIPERKPSLLIPLRHCHLYIHTIPFLLSEKPQFTLTKISTALTFFSENLPMSTTTADEEAMVQRKELWLAKMRGWLMVVAVLVASVTYQAGLNPPGGFWQDDMATFPVPGDATTYISGEGHFAGDPVLRDKNFNRYATFMAFNTAAFVQSLCVIVVLMTESSFHGKLRLYLLRFFVILHVTALGVAYCVGSTRDSYDIYFSGLVMMVLVALLAAISLGVHYHYKYKTESRRERIQSMGSTNREMDDDIFG